jgi:hypothetical protein
MTRFKPRRGLALIPFTQNDPLRDWVLLLAVTGQFPVPPFVILLVPHLLHGISLPALLFVDLFAFTSLSCFILFTFFFVLRVSLLITCRPPLHPDFTTPSTVDVCTLSRQTDAKNSWQVPGTVMCCHQAC